jgi:hypothetical protein
MQASNIYTAHHCYIYTVQDIFLTQIALQGMLKMLVVISPSRAVRHKIDQRKSPTQGWVLSLVELVGTNSY